MQKLGNFFSKAVDGLFWIFGVFVGLLCVVTLFVLLIGFVFFAANTECLELKDGKIMCVTEQVQ